MSIYNFTVKNNKQEDVDLSQYKGKVVLIVNTATKCGLTPQYEALENLYKKYEDKGFVLLDFPCNQFLEQAPGDDAQINEFCQLNYGTSFPRFSKIDVNGENTHPLFAYLKEIAPQDKEDSNTKDFNEKIKGLSKFNGDADIKWNFTKFLIDKSGTKVVRFFPTYDLNNLESEIAALLNE
ncbi:MAG TPA: glutathione peroxidase [Candidatus Merdenecus merdavium]|nr:glutathione peroxidase [Candidatus Merdenecus merdavium]